MIPFKKPLIASITLIASAIFALSYTAQADSYFGSIDVDAGSYSPVALGEDISLNGCGSIFDATIPPASFNLCEAVTLPDLQFEWTISKFGEATETTVSGPTYALSTGGIGDYVSSAGIYTLTLAITALTNPIDLVGGHVGTWSGDSTNTATSAFQVTAAVPEPATALLLLPALFYIGRRQRKRSL